MEAFLLYIGKAALAAAAFYLLYLALFQHQKHFTFNRIFLPVSLALSFIIPLITFTSIRYIEAAPVSYDGYAYLAESTVPLAEPVFQWQWYHSLISIYTVGSVGFLLYLILGHLRAISIIRNSRLQNLFNVKVNVTFRDVHPFSFFNKIVLSEKTLNNPNLGMIVQHEEIHVRGKHTLDILFAEILFLFQWFNPFAWLLKDAIKNNLEYLTDNELTRTNDAQQYQLAMVGLAHKQGVAPFLTALNGSQLKNRIIMMKKKTENKYALLKQLVVLPLLAILVMGLSNKEVRTEIVQANENSINNTSEKIIKGKVTDQNGRPLQTVAVVIKDKAYGTITDEVGNYSIEVGENDKTLLFSYLDIDEKEVPIAGVELNVQLNTNETAKKPEINFTGDLFDGTFKMKNSKGEFVKPLYVLNGEETENFVAVERGNLGNISYMNDELATKYYGSKGKNGVVQISTKDWKFPNGSKPLIIVDGKEYNGKIEDLPKENVFNIRELRYPNFTEEYGEKGKDGVIEISTTKMQMVLLNKHKPKTPDGFLGGTFSAEADLSKLNTNYQDTIQKSKGTVYSLPDDMPEFPGGELALKKYLANSVIYPKTAMENGIQGKVYVTFVVNKEGRVADARIARGVDPLLDKEALRVINNLPLWEPGKKEGENVNVSYTLPIVFALPNSPTINKVTTVSNTGNNPLYVVDGKVRASIDNLDPNNIESIDVLKDASATALYGESGKHGVILITTRSGKDATGEEIRNDVTGEKSSRQNVVTAIAPVQDKKAFSGKSPLIMLDGKKYEGDMNDVDPGDIFSVSVLKDSSATALFGNAAKDGVVIIQTHSYKISSIMDMRKFMARQIKYPVKAQEAGQEAVEKVAIRVGLNGQIEKVYPSFPQNSEFQTGAVSLDEVVVVAYKSSTPAVSVPDFTSNVLEQEARRVVSLLPHIDIPELLGKDVIVTIRFMLQ